MSTATPSLSDLSFVPLDRLVVLLSQRVASSGMRLTDILGHEVPPGTDLDPRQLPESTIRRLADTVQERVGWVIPGRSELRVDLPARRLRIGTQQIRLLRRRRVEYICRQYLRLVYAVRELAPGARFPVRGDDLRSLSDATSVPFAVLRTQLWREMEYLSLADEPLARRLRDHLLLPAAGVAVSAVSFAGFEIARRSSGPRLIIDGTAAAPTVGSPPAPSSGGASAGSTSFETGTGSSAHIVLPTVAASPSAGTDGDALVDFPSGSVAAPLPEPFAPSPGSPATTGAAALELIDYAWGDELPDWTIEFQGHRQGRLGYAFFAEKRIEIYVRPGQSPQDVAQVIAHELGHAIDITLFETEDRHVWLAARNLSDAAWWPTPGAQSDFESGAGDWAEAFSQWLLHDTSQSELGGALTEAQLETVADLVYD